MRLYWVVLACSTVAFAQSFEASVKRREIAIHREERGHRDRGYEPPAHLQRQTASASGFRMTLNSWRFMGHEFGYA